MRFTTTIRTGSRSKWKRSAGAVLTLVLLSAVTVAGFMQLGTELFAASNAPESAQESANPGNVFAGLLNFEAPAWSVAREEAQREAEERFRRTDNITLLVGNWRFTQSPIADLLQLVLQTVNQDLQILQMDVSNAVTAVAILINNALAAYSSLVNAYVMAITNVSTNTTINNTNNTSSSSHHASPFK